LEKGCEYGTTTGRARRCGWLDLVVVRHSLRLSSLDAVVITKIDVLSGLSNIMVCKAYDLDGQVITEFPASLKVLARCKPIYDELIGWNDFTKEEGMEMAEKGYDALPKKMKEYCGYIEDSLGVPIDIVSLGPGREETVDLRK
jgi:adenylosuccinate synthase